MSTEDIKVLFAGDDMSEIIDSRNENFGTCTDDSGEEDCCDNRSEKKSEPDPIFELPDTLAFTKPRVTGEKSDDDYNFEVLAWLTVKRLYRAFARKADQFEISEILRELKKCEQHWYFRVLDILMFWQESMIANYADEYEMRLVILNKFLRRAL
jgi:hypothetical protein